MKQNQIYSQTGAQQTNAQLQLKLSADYQQISMQQRRQKAQSGLNQISTNRAFLNAQYSPIDSNI